MSCWLLRLIYGLCRVDTGEISIVFKSESLCKQVVRCAYISAIVCAGSRDAVFDRSPSILTRTCLFRCKCAPDFSAVLGSAAVCSAAGREAFELLSFLRLAKS